VWNYNGNQSEFEHYRDVLKGHCRDVGRDFDEIRITCVSGGIAWDDEEELEVFRGRIRPQGRTPEELFGFVDCHGSREQCREFLGRWKSLGVDGVIFYFNDIASYGEGASQPEIFEREILPGL
jgi:alkanesulfonate monooxygenase SsuD/methylene tetrahydromethanopterin reductase-like flavin-dependent oxidoreductase (luciferase family)